MFPQLLQPIVLGVQTLRLHKLRALLTILGVVFGVASVIVMLAIGEGARSAALAAIEQLGATNVLVRSVRPADRLAGGANAGAIRYGLTHRDLEHLRTALPANVMMAATRDHRRDLRAGDRHCPGRVVGVTPEYRTLNQLQLQRGRFITDLDVARALPVAVLAGQAAQLLFPLSDPLGQQIRIGEDQYYQVIGVARPRAAVPPLGSDLPAQDYARDVYIPLTTDQKRFGENVMFDRTGSQPPEKVEISQVTVSAPDTRYVKAVAGVIQAHLQGTGKVHETTLVVPLDLLEKAERTQRIFTWVLTAIASISLLVGGIGIMNIMLATVSERTREIGVRRALGARRSDIISQFLIETTVLSCTGGVLGIGLGAAGALAASHWAGVATLIRPWSPLLAFGISVAVGLVFGIYPARRAALLDPIEALRHE
jgi:putative ABC transport system permease protein